MHQDVPGSVPLGPQSVLGRIVTDPRNVFTGFSTGLMQLMHPAVSAAVIDQGEFFKDPFDRVYRSVPRIVATVTAVDGAARSIQVRDYHRAIKGVDANGDRYHALDPDVYWWTHMCFVWGYLQTADVYTHRPLRGVVREQFYAETVEWWRRYGMSMRMVPKDLDSFLADFDDRCTRLEWTAAAEGALNVTWFRAPLPSPLGSALGVPATPVLRLAMIGNLPPEVRTRLGLKWTAADQVEYRALALAVAQAGRLMPTGPGQRLATVFLRNLGARTQLFSHAAVG